MKQFTTEQAIAIAESKEWENWTAEQIVRLQLFQDKLCLPFGIFHRSVEDVLGRPIYTHEFVLNYKGIVEEYLATRPEPTLDEIIALIPEEKRIIIQAS